MAWTIDDDNHDSFLSGEETNMDGNIGGSGALKKGSWTPAEDAVLIDYIKKHGEGNWNAVQKFSGLSRCDKSCRLRWANHLRPDLKKDAFTPEEEDTVIRLHAKLGNKWARMAAELPGRTDNEIKNFFNTRKKRLERAGHPLYPDDISKQNISHESVKSSVSVTFSNELQSSHNLMDAGILRVPVFKIDHSLCSESYSSKFLGNMLPQDLVPSCGFHYQVPTIHSKKRFRDSDASNSLTDTATSSLFAQWNCNAQFGHDQPYELPPLPESYWGDNSSFQIFTGSHALINGTHSTSNPSFGFVNLELPSLQSSDSDCCFWDPPFSPLPSIKRTDTLLQSPEARLSQLHSAPDTDGLLESLVWPSKKVKTSEVGTDPIEKVTTDDLDDLLVDISEPEWESFPDSIPHMGSSTAAIFDDLTVTGFSFDELLSTDDMLAPQAKASDADPMTPSAGIKSSNLNHSGDSYKLDSWRPDAWLNANLLSLDTETGKEYILLQEAVSALRGDKHHL